MLEDGSEVDADNLVFPDVDAAEDPLVEITASRAVVGEVVPVRIGEEISALLEHGSKVIRLHGGFRNYPLGSYSRRLDPGLLGAQYFHADGIGVERLERLVSLLLKKPQLVSGFLATFVATRYDGFQVIEDDASNVLYYQIRELDPLPLLLNGGFDQVSLTGDEGAAVLGDLSAHAVEVLVVLTRPATTALVAQRRTALAAVHGALEVVGPDDGLLAADHSLFSDPMASFEQLLRHQRLMSAVVLNAFVGDHTGVVGILQDRRYV